jgi:hypothetical protein
MGLGKKLFGGGAAAAAPGDASGMQSYQLPNGGKAICSPSGPIIVRF